MDANLGIALLLSTLAGLSTTIGSVLGIFARRPGPRFMTLTLGFSAGVMILVSFVELLPHGIAAIGFLEAHVAFFGGMAAMFLIDVLIPHEYLAEEHHPLGRLLKWNPLNRGRHWFRRPAHGPQNPTGEPRDEPRFRQRAHGPQDRLLKTGLLVALGLAIHNFPEGMATFAGTLGDVRLGGAIAVAIMLHNIPEGLAVSAPVYAATGSRAKAFLWSFLSGAAEPVGALLTALFLLPFLSEALLGVLLAGVAGVMVFISLDELVPVSCSFGEEHLSIVGVGIGMAVMAASLGLLR